MPGKLGFKSGTRLQHIVRAKGKFSKDFIERANKLMRAGAREYVRAMIVKIPVWTGFAKGSIKYAQGPTIDRSGVGNLSQVLNIAIPITRVSETPRWYYHPGRVHRIRKSETQGFRYGRFNFSFSGKVFRFTFESKVSYMVANEFTNSVSKTSPWGALEAGQTAMKAHIDSHIATALPNLLNYFVAIPIGGKVIDLRDQLTQGTEE